jgi:hypothetical protein
MTTHSISCAPHNALHMWANNESILVELPVRSGGFTLLTFPRNSLGLSKALALIAPPVDFHGGTYTLPRSKRPVGTVMQQTAAESLLRARGILK